VYAAQQARHAQIFIERRPINVFTFSDEAKIRALRYGGVEETGNEANGTLTVPPSAR
jgi:hypothetical protein